MRVIQRNSFAGGRCAIGPVVRYRRPWRRRSPR